MAIKVLGNCRTTWQNREHCRICAIRMNAFPSTREAKEFLISTIVEEAQRENIVLSETERKMLYFSETAWTSPDMDTVSDEFDREFCQRDYERKITRLIRNAGKRIRRTSTSDYDAVWQAIRMLEQEDHYIMVMVRQSGLRPRGDLLRLWLTGLVVVVVLTPLIFLSASIPDRFSRYLSRDAFGLYVWAGVCLLLIAYQFCRTIWGPKRVDDRVLGLLRWILGQR